MLATVRSVILSIVLVLIISSGSYGWTYNDLAETKGAESSNDLKQFLAAGTVISYLPDGARSVIVDNTQYFVAQGVWFLPVMKSTVQYMVVLDPV